MSILFLLFLSLSLFLPVYTDTFVLGKHWPEFLGPLILALIFFLPKKIRWFVLFLIFPAFQIKSSFIAFVLWCCLISEAIAEENNDDPQGKFLILCFLVPLLWIPPPKFLVFAASILACFLFFQPKFISFLSLGIFLFYIYTTKEHPLDTKMQTCLRIQFQPELVSASSLNSLSLHTVLKSKADSVLIYLDPPLIHSQKDKIIYSDSWLYLYPKLRSKWRAFWIFKDPDREGAWYLGFETTTQFRDHFENPLHKWQSEAPALWLLSHQILSHTEMFADWPYQKTKTEVWPTQEPQASILACQKTFPALYLRTLFELQKTSMLLDEHEITKTVLDLLQRNETERAQSILILLKPFFSEEFFLQWQVKIAVQKKIWLPAIEIAKELYKKNPTQENALLYFQAMEQGAINYIRFSTPFDYETLCDLALTLQKSEPQSYLRWLNISLYYRRKQLQNLEQFFSQKRCNCN